MFKPLSALLLALFVVTPALAGDPPPKGFSSSKEDVFGYYMPVKAIRSGKFTLYALSVSSRYEFVDFERGKDRLPNWTPVMFLFQDKTSKATENDETGRLVYASEPRVLATAYRIKGNTLAFIGKNKLVGDVSFNGRFDMGPVKKAAKESMTYTERPVMWGDLTIGKQTFRNIAFTWFGGD